MSLNPTPYKLEILLEAVKTLKQHKGLVIENTIVVTH